MEELINSDQTQAFKVHHREDQYRIQDMKEDKA